MQDYLEHHFPVILHTAKPVRLDEYLKQKLNVFLPLYRKALEEAINAKGRKRSNYRLFEPHDMAVVLLPGKFIVSLCQNNKSTFLTGFYCFELKTEVDMNTLAYILENNFHLKDCYFFEFENSLLNDNSDKVVSLITEKAIKYEEIEYNLFIKGEKNVRIHPRVFKNIDIETRVNYCFVLMPFEDTLKEIYEDCIKVDINQCSMICERADDIFCNTSIMEIIWMRICSAEIIIADLTGKNPNVFYEVGIAHALGKEVILLTQSPDDVPFDLRHIKYIQYSMTGRGQEKLIQDISLTISSIKGLINKISDHI